MKSNNKKPEKKNEEKYSLILNKRQLKILNLACEFYARMKIGQFGELSFNLLDLRDKDFCKKRDKVDELMLEVRKIIYPDLHGVGHSYGIGKFDEADLAYDIHQVARKELGDSREPFSLYEELPKIVKVGECNENI